MSSQNFEAECKVFVQDFIDYFNAAIVSKDDLGIPGNFVDSFANKNTMYKSNIYLISKYEVKDDPNGIAIIALGTFSYMNAVPVIVGLWNQSTGKIRYSDTLPMFLDSIDPPDTEKDPYIILVNKLIVDKLFRPIENRVQDKKMVAGAQDAIRSICQVYDEHMEVHKAAEGLYVEQALKEAKVAKQTLRYWKFDVVGNPPVKFYATSTAYFPAGEGKQIWYEVSEDKFHGFLIDE
jgi:hypothetical protein